MSKVEELKKAISVQRSYLHTRKEQSYKWGEPAFVSTLTIIDDYEKLYQLIKEVEAEQAENQLSIADILDVIDDSVNYVKLQKSFKGVCSKSAEEVLDEVITYGSPLELKKEQEELQKKADAYDEQNKPVEFPPHIINYLDYAKKRGYKVQDLLNNRGLYDSDNRYWTEDETREIVVAYITGNYTVKQEQLYYVKITAKEYLCCDIDDDEYFTDSLGEVDGYKMKFTESEIKAIDERYLPFAVKVEEE
ncbi:DUF1642 domain-containing protein [Enterococcus sp. BWM-S5]|uniref:DUF1642 domain-containing protein n=1 Tax=Enterococcus larvae TaxID=2794352 RepID=A0ABS4CE51_9ENTE|nr:DUF1642 domain-containing protein [Enterococcus larvae]MBP1044864.1 DUF1642 domain-containing protein [Enterococcus larvae]